MTKTGMKVLRRIQYKDQIGIESFTKDPIQGPDSYREFYEGPNTRTRFVSRVL
jgi:hypothetical protein